MPRARTEHGLWPLPSTELLLRAALEEDPARGRAAFVAWHGPGETRDVATLGSPERRLLPLVRARLTAGGFAHPAMAAYEPLHRRASERNRELLRAASDAARALDGAGVPALALKGLVLLLRYYEDPALRPMSDVDLLVRPQDRDGALGALARAGFVGRPVAPRLRPYLTAFEAVRPADHVEVDLHQYLIEYGAPPAEERGLWERARPIDLGGGVRLPGVSAEDLLLHVCVASLKFGRHRNSRWVVDAAAILRREAGALDWDLLVRAGIRRGAARPLGECLGYLSDAHGLPVPEAAIAALLREPVTGRQRRRYRALTRRPATIGAVIEQQRSLYEFGAEAAGLARGPLAFMEFSARHLLHWWRVPSIAGVPLEASRRLLRLITPGAPSRAR